MIIQFLYHLSISNSNEYNHYENICKTNDRSDYRLKMKEDLGNYEVLGVNKQSKRRKKVTKQHYGHLIPDVQNQLASKLTDYVPAAVKPHLDMPQQIWTGELREVTILFVSLPWNARSFAKFTNNILQQLQKGENIDIKWGEMFFKLP